MTAADSIINRAITYLRAAGYTVARTGAGYWLITGPACIGSYNDAELLAIAHRLEVRE
jgi:hypothetical protein